MSWPTVNFVRSEFACNCECGFDTPDYGLVCTLDELQAKIETNICRPCRVYITSACRCVEYNKKVGGSIASQHLYGRAADLKVEMLNSDGKWLTVDPDIVADCADEMEVGGLGRYNTFTHVDTRAGKGRWDKRS